MKVIRKTWAIKRMRGAIIIPGLYMLAVGLPCDLPAAGISPVGAQQVSAEMAWVDRSGSSHEIMYSSLNNGEWSGPVQLSKGGLMNLVPTLVKSGDDKTHVVWPVALGSGIKLYHTTLESDKSSEEPVVFHTGLASNNGAFLSVDKDGTPWLAWSGNNGSPSDVYFSTFNGGKWQMPQMVHEPNQVPDVQPELIIADDGSVVVEWLTFGADGYIRVNTVLKSSGGPVEVPVRRSRTARRSECIDKLPDEVSTAARGTILQRCTAGGERFQSRLSAGLKR